MARHGLREIKATVLIATVSLFCIAAEELGAYCPDEETLLASQHSTKTTKVSVKFINSAGIEVTIYWVNFDNQEIPVCLLIFELLCALLY